MKYFSNRAQKQIDGLKKLIDEFPAHNDHEADLFALRDKMKNKLRVITSLLGVNQKYIMTEPPKMTY
jgi:DNA-binding transcriptional regulator GbsR (MarR family)